MPALLGKKIKNFVNGKKCLRTRKDKQWHTPTLSNCFKTIIENNVKTGTPLALVITGKNFTVLQPKGTKT